MNWKANFNKYAEVYTFNGKMYYLVATFDINKPPALDNPEHLELLENPGNFDTSDDEQDIMVLNFGAN